MAGSSIAGRDAALARPETWPDYASETGRSTPLRPGGLDWQTFEIEVAAATGTPRPLFTRAFWGTDARRSMLVQLARRIA